MSYVEGEYEMSERHVRVRQFVGEAAIFRGSQSGSYPETGWGKYKQTLLGVGLGCLFKTAHMPCDRR